MDKKIWQKCFINFPRRDINGAIIWPSLAQTWRRQVDGKWEYRQDEESLDDWLDRQV
jgi:hypothetical protein